MSKSIIDNAQSNALKRSKVFRPVSEYKKRPKNQFFDDYKSINSESFLSFMNRPVSAQEKVKMQKKVLT